MIYDFNYEMARQNLVIKQFAHADVEWLNFVCQNRKGETPLEEADLYIGPVADDSVYRSIRLFETGIYTVQETIKRLKTEVLHDQWTFHTEKSLKFCHFVDALEIKSGG